MKLRLLPVICSLAITLPLWAADWPQWQGPDRTNVSKETGLLKEWPKEGPKLLWTFEKAGIGYSSPAIVGDRLYTMGARNDTEMIYALDVKTGDEVWATPIGKQFVNNWGDGPRGTPTVDGDFVYGIGGQGDIICVEAANGKKVWEKNMQKDFGGKMMSGWGYTESPLIDGDHLICTPGGPNGTMAALDKKTGNVVWRSKGIDDPAAYSSIIVAEVNNIKQYVNLTGKGIIGVAAKDGKPLWTYHQNGYRTAVIPTPIFTDGQVYATSGYGAGCDLVKLSPDGQKFKADKVYANKNMVNHHGGVVLWEGCVYGYSDDDKTAEPRRPAGWVCQDLQTGAIKWIEAKSLGKGSLTCVDGRLYCYSQDKGTAVLIEAAPDAWKEHGRFTIPRQTKLPRKSGQIWTHPVVAGGKLYLRDQDLIFCFDVKANQ